MDTAPATLRIPRPGAGYASADRDTAVERGLESIYRTATDADIFADYGYDLLWCFYTISATARNPKLRRRAREMGRERAIAWRRGHSTVPRSASCDDVVDLIFGSDAADRLGVRDPAMKHHLRRKAARYSVADFMLFDPGCEPPPSNVPRDCGNCDHRNARGRTECRSCGHPLKMRDRYDIWTEALVTAHTLDHYGIATGARYSDVIRWIRVMRPYPSGASLTTAAFFDVAGAVTHVVYTLNHYGMHRLSPKWLPQEYHYLKTNLEEMMKREDPEMVGEFLDTLRAFGMTDADPLIRCAVEYLISTQNADGSWGGPDVYHRYHSTWTALDGLRLYAWHRRPLTSHRLKKLVAGKRENLGSH